MTLTLRQTHRRSNIESLKLISDQRPANHAPEQPTQGCPAVWRDFLPRALHKTDSPSLHFDCRPAVWREPGTRSRAKSKKNPVITGPVPVTQRAQAQALFSCVPLTTKTAENGRWGCVSCFSVQTNKRQFSAGFQTLDSRTNWLFKAVFLSFAAISGKTANDLQTRSPIRLLPPANPGATSLLLRERAESGVREDAVFKSQPDPERFVLQAGKGTYVELPACKIKMEMARTFHSIALLPGATARRTRWRAAPQRRVTDEGWRRI